MRLISVLLYFFCQVGLSSNLYSQELEVGDHVPDMTLQHVINIKQQNLRLSDFKGKLIILDFWSIYCSSCIAGFPELDSLQKMYKDKIQIIAVNRETEDSTLKFLKKHKNIKLPDIPFVMGDTLLKSHFPYRYVPHNVWIDSNNIVRFITAGYNTTANSIDKFLSGEDLKLFEKKDVFDFNFDKPFILEGNGRWFDKVVYYSYIMHHIPGVNSGAHREIDSSGNIHLYMTDGPLDLFRNCMAKWSPYKFLSKNQIILQVKNPEMYYPPDAADIDEEEAKNYFIYDLYLPKPMAPRLYSIIQQDLERFFDVTVAIKKKKIKCLALIRTSKKDKVYFTKEKSEINRGAMINGSLTGEWEGKIGDLVIGFNLLLSRNGFPPIIDKTNYLKRISVGMDKQKIYSKKLDVIRKEFKRFDLDLIETYLMQDVIVIKDKNN